MKPITYTVDDNPDREHEHQGGRRRSDSFPRLCKSRLRRSRDYLCPRSNAAGPIFNVPDQLYDGDRHAGPLRFPRAGSRPKAQPVTTR